MIQIFYILKYIISTILFALIKFFFAGAKMTKIGNEEMRIIVIIRNDWAQYSVITLF